MLWIVLVLTINSCKKKDAVSYYNENPYKLLLTYNDFKFGCYVDENLKNSREHFSKTKGNKKLELMYYSKFKNDSTGLFLTIHNTIIISKTDSETQNDYKEHWKDIFSREVKDSFVTKNDLSDKLKFGNSTFIEFINKVHGIKTYAFEGVRQNKFVVFTISGCLNRDSVANKIRTQICKIDSL